MSRELKYSRTPCTLMIDAESIINVDRSQSPRDYLNNLLASEDTAAVLIFQVINPHYKNYLKLILNMPIYSMDESI